VILLFSELVLDVFPDRLLIPSANRFNVVAWRPEFAAPEILFFDIGEPGEEFPRTDALEDIEAFGDGDRGWDHDESVDVVGRNVDLRDLHIIIVSGFDENLLEYRPARFLEDGVSIFGCPDQMVFQSRDMVFGVLQVHTLDSLARNYHVHYFGKPLLIINSTSSLALRYFKSMFGYSFLNTLNTSSTNACPTDSTSLKSKIIVLNLSKPISKRLA
jgi:hypothetical protein